MIRDTLTENKSFMYVNGKRITRFLFRGIELSSVQWTDNKKYFVLKNLTQTDFGGQTGTFYLVVDENGSIGFSTSLDPLKLTLAVLDVSYYTNNDWLPGNVGGLSIELQKDTRYLIDSHKKLRLSKYPIEIVPTNDQSSQTPEIVLSANTALFTNIPYLPLRIRIENDDGKSKLVFGGGTGNNILTILDNGKIGIGTTSPNKTLSIIDSGVGIDRPDTNTLSFYTSNTERLRIDSLGNVGIGTGTFPLSQKLVVAGDIGLKTNTDAFIGTLDTFGLSLRTNNTDRIYITNEGNVGIGTTNPRGKFEINKDSGSNLYPAIILDIDTTNTNDGDDFFITTFGNGGTTNIEFYIENWGDGYHFRRGSASGKVYAPIYAASFNVSSDIRLKEIVNNINSNEALRQILNLQAVRFYYKNDETKKQNIGLIAQEVEKVIPEVVNTESLTEEHYKSIAYDKLVTVLIEAIKEQQKQIEELKSEIQNLKQLITGGDQL